MLMKMCIIGEWRLLICDLPVISHLVSDDHSRVKLENSENDYINASLVMVEEAQRAYILSQVRRSPGNVSVCICIQRINLWTIILRVHFFLLLPQGPLRNTCGHFWLMIWEQCSKAVIMLNRVIEKGSVSTLQHMPITDFLVACYTRVLGDMFQGVMSWC